MSETEKPAETPAAPAPDPERVKLEASLAEAQRRILEAESRAAYASGVAAAAASGRQPQPTGPDPLEDYSKNDLTMSPEEKRRALSAAIERRSQLAEQRTAQAFEQRMAQERAQWERQSALDSVVSQLPEISDPKNAAKFGAAITKVKMEAEAQGVQLSPMQLAQRAKGEYETLFRPQSAPRPPFVEGASRPDLNPGMNPQQYQGPTPQNALEKTYGVKANTIRPLVDPNDTEAMDKFNMEYVSGKNKPLFARGVVSSLENVLATNRVE